MVYPCEEGNHTVVLRVLKCQVLEKTYFTCDLSLRMALYVNDSFSD